MSSACGAINESAYQMSKNAMGGNFKVQRRVFPKCIGARRVAFESRAQLIYSYKEALAPEQCMYVCSVEMA